MSTQLHLVETTPTNKTRRARIAPAGVAAPGRRAATWGEWRLDTRARKVGRQGVAAAREALERVRPTEERLRRAS